MNAIIYYSNTLESYNIAKYISIKTSYELINISNLNNYDFDFIYLIFPIHYQSIPKTIKPLIKKLKAKKAIIIATYGKMSFGNVLNDVKKILNAKIVSASYIPTKHSYIKNDLRFSDFKKIDDIILNMNNDKEIKIKKSFKNPFANLFPILRHKIAIKIIKNNKCINCNKCHEICENIINGKTDNNCIRCLKCIDHCPYNALDFKLSFFMKIYLKKKKKDKFIIYK